MSKRKGTAVPREPEQTRKERIMKASSMRTRMKASAKLYSRLHMKTPYKEE